MKTYFMMATLLLVGMAGCATPTVDDAVAAVNHLTYVCTFTLVGDNGIHATINQCAYASALGTQATLTMACSGMFDPAINGTAGSNKSAFYLGFDTPDNNGYFKEWQAYNVGLAGTRQATCSGAIPTIGKSDTATDWFPGKLFSQSWFICSRHAAPYGPGYQQTPDGCNIEFTHFDPTKAPGSSSPGT